MKLTTNFKLIELNNVEREPRVLVSRHGIRFNKPCSELLNYTEYVKVYLNDKEKMIAVIPCTKQTAGATKFYRSTNKKCKNASWTNGRFLNLVAKLGGWDLEQSSIGLFPKVLEDGGIYLDFAEGKKVSRSVIKS